MKEYKIKKKFDATPNCVRRGSVLLNKELTQFVTVVSIENVTDELCEFIYFSDGDYCPSSTEIFCYIVYLHEDDDTYSVSKITKAEDFC